MNEERTIPTGYYENIPQTQDHSLAITLANELVRMQQNLDNMEQVKGVSQLKNRVRSLFATLRSKQYEVIADLCGRPVHDGDNYDVTMEQNEQMEKGTNRIKRVIRPQVSFAGKMIQSTMVVVEYNE